GQGVVLEFILYKPAPNPLTAYEDGLGGVSASVTTVALTASVAEILNRMKRRRRQTDLADVEGRRRNAEHQVRVLESGDPSCVIDSTELSIDDAVLEVLHRVNR